MEVLKWIGYTVAAIGVLSVVLGIGLAVAAAVATAGAIAFVALIVFGVAALLRSFWNEVLRR